MAKEVFNDLVEDYAITAVPEDKRTNGFKVGLINSALCLTLPSMVVGAQLGVGLGFEQAIWACLLAMVVLVLIGTLTGLVGSKAGVSTYVILRFSLGGRGAELVSLIFAISMFGWFGINITLFGEALVGLFAQINIAISPQLGMIIGGGLATLTGIFGFKSLDKLSLFMVPVLAYIVVILYMQGLELHSFSELLAAKPQTEPMNFGLGVSILVGGLITICVAQPDLTRYTRTVNDSFWSVFTPFAIAQPFVVIGVSLGAIAYQDSDIVGLLLKAGFGLWAFIMIICSSWVGNAINLYACSLSLASIFQRVDKWKLAVVTGIAGTVAGLLGVMDRVTEFLALLSIIVSPVAAVYLLDFFWLKRGQYDLSLLKQLPDFNWAGLIAIAAGAGVGQLVTIGLFQMSAIPALDSLVVALLVYGIFGLKFSNRVVKEG